ncbi:MAG: adenosylmethionine decarboxylase [Candidatus Gracilibacteria bacterium]|nr:adenosylmethionine decarboxylase [Candidatus Gracilibacteria bacterium]
MKKTNLIKIQKISGTHIVGDLYECDFDYFINKKPHKDLENFFKQKVLDFGLNVIGSQIHSFKNNSFSLIIMLSESHLCIHTWPENNYVSLDIFVCNYTRDNSIIAKNLFDEIIEYFKSQNKKINIINR